MVTVPLFDMEDITGAVKVLFVRVSVLVLATKVSAPVGMVTVPLFDMEDITGAVKVLFVKVCASSNWTISAFVMDAILVAVAALPVTSPVKFPVIVPVTFNVPAISVLPLIFKPAVGFKVKSPILVVIVPTCPLMLIKPPSDSVSVDGWNEYPFVMLTTLSDPFTLNKA